MTAFGIMAMTIKKYFVQNGIQIAIQHDKIVNGEDCEKTKLHSDSYRIPEFRNNPEIDMKSQIDQKQFCETNLLYQWNRHTIHPLFFP